jgi:Uma2 family endonuclease
MPTVNVFSGEKDRVSVPDWVLDLESFRRWLDSDELPEKARISYLQGEVWLDMSKEQVYTHLLVKHEFTFTLTGLVKAANLGVIYPDGLLLVNIIANLSGNPDATFVSHETMRAERVRPIERFDGGCLELEGTPDMVLEVVSDSSVQKDRVILRQAYWEAGIPEYWLVDVRKDPLKFDILRHTPKGYSVSRKQNGWVKSAIFGRAFRLIRVPSTPEQPQFKLEVR